MSKIRTLFILLVGILSFSSCLKEPVDPVAEELLALEKYMQNNYPEIEPTSSGLYIVPQKTGFGNKPQTGDTLYINYVGTFLDGTEFDNTNDALFEYIVGGEVELISGFYEGIMSLREGQTALLIMPSTLAYGDRQNGMIAPYSTLIFNVEMHQIKSDTQNSKK